MKEYIEREAAIKALDGDGTITVHIQTIIGAGERLKAIPAADVREVVRGEWKEWWPGDCALIMTGEEMLWRCSVCDAKYAERENFCPNCGADMRGERNGGETLFDD